MHKSYTYVHLAQGCLGYFLILCNFISISEHRRSLETLLDSGLGLPASANQLEHQLYSLTTDQPHTFLPPIALDLVNTRGLSLVELVTGSMHSPLIACLSMGTRDRT